jgi:ubiquitin carboxyl-terminal hydrolase L5
MDQPLKQTEASPKLASTDGLQDMPTGTLAPTSNGKPSQSTMEQTPPTIDPAELHSAATQPLTPDSPNSKKRALVNSLTEEEPVSKKLKDSLEMPSEHKEEVATPAFPSPPDYPATKHDKETWQGFCDIESEPAYFSVILREMGVQDVTVREVFSMSPDYLAELPQPIYGLILLFRYREFGNEDQAEECPNNVWFANQLPAQNSCGTLAMLNILMNSPDVTVGEHLQQFKDFTSSMTPYQRGEALASFDFVKKIHNSFAKKMDLLENDKHLSYKVRRGQRQKELASQPKSKSKSKSTSKSRSRRQSADSVATDDSAEFFEENGHHFIAFVPVGTEVYKLDGMDRQPTSVGTFTPEAGETWLDGASDTIATLMAAGDDDYGVVALIQSPLAPSRRKACLTINTLARVESRLDSLDASWRASVTDDHELTSPRLLGIEALLPDHPVPASLADTIDSEDLPDLLSRRAGLDAVLSEVAATMMEDMALIAAEDEKARQRRFDGGPVVKKWLEMLAANQYLETNLTRFM